MTDDPILCDYCGLPARHVVSHGPYYTRRVTCDIHVVSAHGGAAPLPPRGFNATEGSYEDVRAELRRRNSDK